MEPGTISNAVVVEDQIKPLRTLLHATALSMLILTATVFIFFYRQVVNVRRSTAELATYIAEYERSNASTFIGEVHRKLAEFKNQHPDFSPIYARYFGTNPPPAKAESGSKMLPAPGQ